MEQTTLSADVRFAQVLHTVDDGSSHCSSDTVVVRLANPSKRSDVSFEKVMLGEIYGMSQLVYK